MGYVLAMSGEIRDWLIGLGSDDPAAALAVGQALVALIGEGAGLGPPLVAELTSPPADLPEALDQAYQERLENAQSLRRLRADADALVQGIESQIAELEGADAGPKAAELAELRSRLPEARASARRLAEASERAMARTGAFRARKEVLKATYTVAQAELAISESLAAPGEDGDPLAEATARLRGVTTDIEAELGQGAHGLLELRPGALGGSDVRILFAVEPAGAALLISVIEGAGPGSREHGGAVAVSADVLWQVREGQDPQASEHAFEDARSFLDEFFSGSASEVQAGAAALIARNRVGSLAAQRIARGLTQAQVAERMGVPPEQVLAIERAEPGAIEVRALARYVDALGGRLELIADFGAERVQLRQ